VVDDDGFHSLPAGDQARKLPESGRKLLPNMAMDGFGNSAEKHIKVSLKHEQHAYHGAKNIAAGGLLHFLKRGNPGHCGH